MSLANYFKSILVVALMMSLFSNFLLPSTGYANVEGSEQDKAKLTADDGAFTYNPIGLRDPFVPLVQEVRKSIKKPKKDLGPLEKFQLNQFRLMAMLIIKGTPMAMVKAPDGKSYTVKPGDNIGSNEGIVKRIETKVMGIDQASGQRIEKSPDRVVVEETGIDNFTGKEFKQERYIEM